MTREGERRTRMEAALNGDDAISDGCASLCSAQRCVRAGRERARGVDGEWMRSQLRLPLRGCDGVRAAHLSLGGESHGATARALREQLEAQEVEDRPLSAPLPFSSNGGMCSAAQGDEAWWGDNSASHVHSPSASATSKAANVSTPSVGDGGSYTHRRESRPAKPISLILIDAPAMPLICSLHTPQPLTRQRRLHSIERIFTHRQQPP